MAARVWRAVVENTQRMLGEILGALISAIVSNLANPNEERQAVAGRCLGECVRKMPDRVLPDLMPRFIEDLNSEDNTLRQGVTLGLCEVIEHAVPGP